MAKKQKFIETLDINSIVENPENPRHITALKFNKLVKSVKEFPEMLEARPLVIDPDNVVLGGNMRLKACKEAGLKNIPVYRATWEEVKQRDFVIKDNVSYGEWDWDMLANEYDFMELDEMGMDLDPAFFQDEDADTTHAESVDVKFNDYTIYFSNEEQMDVWFEFMTKLKNRFSEHENVSDRVLHYISEVYEDNGMKDSELILKFIEYDVNG